MKLFAKFRNKQKKPRHVRIGSPTDVQRLFSVTLLDENDNQERNNNPHDPRRKLMIRPYQLRSQVFADTCLFARYLEKTKEFSVVLQPRIKVESSLLSGRELKCALADIANDEDDYKTRFTLQKEIGFGVSGIVYLATDHKLNQAVVIKAMNVMLTEGGNIIREIQLMRDLCRDAKATNMVHYLDCFVLGKSVCLVMEYVPAGPLTDLLERIVLKESQMAAIVLDILQAISFLHSKNIVHRDIKSANILIDENGSVKLCDFGFAIRMEPDERFLTKMGTLSYLAPEFFDPASILYDYKVDIWALGIIVMELIEGSPPDFDDELAKCFRNKFRPKLKRPAKTSPVLRDFLDKCLQMDPKRRWTANQLLAHPFLQLAADSPSILLELKCCKELREANLDLSSSDSFYSIE